MRGEREEHGEREITKEEIRGAIRKLREDKAVGEDRIPGRYGSMERKD